MGVWKPDGVDVEPEVALETFAVMELPDGDRHLCGRRADGEGGGRVSSRIVSLDPERREAVTRSGRRYRLGDAGLTSQGSYVWNVWCRYNGIDPATARDVTSELFDAG